MEYIKINKKIITNKIEELENDLIILDKTERKHKDRTFDKLLLTTEVELNLYKSILKQSEEIK